MSGQETAVNEGEIVQTALSSISRQSWTSWRGQAPGGHTWLWFDLDGIQSATDLPAQAPIATHLWGWKPGESWVRLRIDDGRVNGSWLVAEAAGVVQATRTAACQWPATEGRVDPRLGERTPTSLRSRGITLVQTPHLTALTFVELAP